MFSKFKSSSSILIDANTIVINTKTSVCTNPKPISKITWNAGATTNEAHPVNSYTNNNITEPLMMFPNKRNAIDKIGVTSLTTFNGNNIHKGLNNPNKCLQL